MKSGRAGIAALVLGGSVLLTGCGAGVGTAGPPADNATQDPFGCGIVVTPATAVVGEDVLVSRPPTEPGDICTTLAPGTTQTLELRSIHVNDSVRQTTSVTVTADGSFETTMTVPSDIRLERVVVTAIPSAESDCTESAAGNPDECYFPRAQFTVELARDDLTPLRMVATDVAMPPLPAGDGEQDSYALAGPGPHELTLVVFGSGCASRPVAYRHNAPAGQLDIVTEVVIPAGADGCSEPRIPWTSVIEIPEGLRHDTAVTVNNLTTVLLDHLFIRRPPD
ncbi:hypothetical protein [Cryobacterium sp.]|jgi:hypothetical protein|uniref:hypothetical protein n=1 Tax=Cryobacterium sp. TaxID=1926290 RepID=UPI002634CB6E|nr:hypothetical protein [Cryobacterium sp.]MCU1447081.1 hypothetical protein [Cryobacterium sp.]